MEATLMMLFILASSEHLLGHHAHATSIQNKLLLSIPVCDYNRSLLLLQFLSRVGGGLRFSCVTLICFTSCVLVEFFPLQEFLRLDIGEILRGSVDAAEFGQLGPKEYFTMRCRIRF